MQSRLNGFNGYKFWFNKKSNRVKYNVIKNKITFNGYLACLKENKEIFTIQRCMRFFRYIVNNVEQTKV